MTATPPATFDASGSASLAVTWRDAEYQRAAEQLANRLNVAAVSPGESPTNLLLQLADDGLSLRSTEAGAPGAVRVDFVEGALAHRRQYGGGAGQMVARAVGLRGAIRPYVLDATAGLGRDAFVLAALGCEVMMLERQPVIAALLADGLSRAAQAGGEVAEIAARMRLAEADAIEAMRDWAGPVPQVIHLDPMFPHRDKSALVKKEMRSFRPLAGDDLDAPKLLSEALALASHRVAVKRPRKAPAIDGPEPNAKLQGQSSRYDIYGLKKLV